MPPTSSAARPDRRPGPAPLALGPIRPRLVPGGYDITRLPLAVPPAPGEQLASWLVRWAGRYALPVSALLSALGAATPPAPAPRVERHLAGLAGTIAAAAGLPALPHSPTAAAATAQVVRYLSEYHARDAAIPARSRYCPRCLAESGGVWLAAWTEPLELVCTRHRLMLLRRCPTCRRARFTTSAWMTHDSDPWTCAEPAPIAGHVPRTRHALCGQDLRQAPTTAVKDDTIDLQRWLRSLCNAAESDPHGAGVACGFPVNHRDRFDAVLELAVEGLGDIRHLTRPDLNPEPLLEALTRARAVLGQPDADTAATLAGRHHLLHPAGPVTPVAPDHVLTQRRRNPLLAAIRLASLAEHLPPSSQLVFRTGSGSPRYPTAPAPGREAPAADQTQLSWIPQLLWPGQLHPWVTDDYLDRAAAAMMLAKVGSARPWRLIAIDLGLPAGFAVHPPNLVRHLQHVGAWPAVLRRLDELATALEADPPPINYQARRWTSADHDLLVAAVNRTRLTLGPVHGWVSTHLLVEVFWQVYTGGDLRLAAPSTGTLLDADQYHDDEGAHVDPTADPDLLGFLTTTADLVSRATGTGASEPLTWQPP